MLIASWWGRNPIRLQWGHVFSDVEITAPASVRGRVRGASMGPRLFRRGNCIVVPHSDQDILLASMGPRLFRRGNEGRKLTPERRSNASMGPRLFRRGNQHFLETFVNYFSASMGPRLFRRGNGRRSRPTRRRSKGFNGATSFQTWKLTSGLLGGGHRPGFNGATSFQTWKSPYRKVLILYAVLASMGPRLFRRGNYLIGDTVRIPVNGFNGATSFQTWK